VRGLQERRAVAALTVPPPVPPPGSLSERGRFAIGAAVAAAAVGADQAAKSLALAGLDDGPIHVVWTLQLRLTFNRGAAFGLGPGLSPVIVGIGVAVLVVFLGFSRQAARTRPAVVALGLVVGGALGNLADRLLRDHGGGVVDFLDLGWWPVFNLADVFITFGAGLLILTSRR